MVAAAPTGCVNHRRRNKVASCGACGGGVCADCIVHTGVGVKCPKCTGVKAAKSSAGARPSAGAIGGPSREAAGGGHRRPWAIPSLVGGLVALALAA